MKVIAANLKNEQLIPFYLMACYLYYYKGVCLMTDAEFDRLCVRLYKAWFSLKHPHKDLIDRAELANRGERPGIIEHAADHALKGKHLGVIKPKLTFKARVKPKLELRRGIK
jgi:hypothetical protein